MNQDNLDDNLLKNLDLINFWEPFLRQHPNLNIGIRAILNDFNQKKKIVKEAKTEIKSVELENFNQPITISYNTINQKAALEGLCNGLNGNYNLISESEDFQSEQLPDSYLFSQALHYRIQLLKWFYQFKGYDKKVFESRFYNFYKRLGQYRHYYRAFLASAPNIRCYIATNDHSGLSQVGFVAARKAGIPTIYIQHASVSDRFPPLKSTYAFLDGEDAKEKYLKSGDTQTQIELLGPMKYDPYLNLPELDIVGPFIGICLGLAHCDIDENIALCKKLAESNTPFCLRFHPLMDAISKAPFEGHGWEFSDPKLESALDFIMRCHSVVSPDSSIHLEALILKRRPIYLAPIAETLDYYDFVKNGLIEAAVHDKEEVLNRIQSPYNMDPYRRKAKRYHAGLYTDWEGKSTEKILDRIKQIAALPLI